MACCALAVFIIGQIVIGYESLRQRFGLAAVAAPRGASDWRLEDGSSIGARRNGWLTWRAGLAATASIVALGVIAAVGPVRAASDLAAMVRNPTHLCLEGRS